MESRRWTPPTLGDDYPGLFDAGDTVALSELLHRAETDVAFLEDLRRRIKRLEPLFDRDSEIRAWAKLLSESVVQR